MRFPLMENTGLLFKLTWPKLFYVGQAVNNWVFLVLITPRIELCLGVGQQYIFFIFWLKKTSKANQIWTWRILRSLVYVRSISQVKLSGQTHYYHQIISNQSKCFINAITLFQKPTLCAMVHWRLHGEHEVEIYSVLKSPSIAWGFL